ncbi:MAG: cell division protein FtsL [Proteobacteria bacterium]|nr:cell division protein FtsL [Pseudomonadota bacterium]
MTRILPVIWTLALLAAVASAMLVVQQAQKVRQLHVQLEAARQKQDEALIMHSRLLLERGALAAYSSVEQTATTKLAMNFPETAERISR